MQGPGLRGRLILGASALVVGFVLLGTAVLSEVLTGYGERQVLLELQGAQTSYESHLGLRRRALRERADLLADAPVLKAVVSTGDRATIESTVEALRSWSARDLVAVLAPGGGPKARLLAALPAAAGRAIAAAQPGDEPTDLLLPAGEALYHVATMPILEGDRVSAILCIGERIDGQTAREIVAATNHDALLWFAGRIVGQARQDAETGAPLIASDAEEAALTGHLTHRPDPVTVELTLAGMPRRVRIVPLHPSGGRLVLSRDPAQLRGLQQSAWTTLVAVGLAIGLAGVLASLAVARRITNPLLALARGADAMSAGDLQARVEVGGGREFAQVAQAFNNMAARIGALLRDVREQASRAEAANHAKDAFLASVSHELRTPATNIRAYAEILADYGPQTSHDEQREFLGIILGQTGHLEALIGQVLDFAELAGTDLAATASPAALAELVQQAIAPLRDAAEAKKITLELALDEELCVRAEARRMQQLVRAVVENALAFAPARTPVEITLVRGGATAVLEIRDHGPGVPDPLKEMIFEPFFQGGDHLTGKPSGIGLGLTVARTIAQAHGGSLRCEDAPGGGACFRLELPVLVAQAVAV